MTAAIESMSAQNADSLPALLVQTACGPAATPGHTVDLTEYLAAIDKLAAQKSVTSLITVVKLTYWGETMDRALDHVLRMGNADDVAQLVQTLYGLYWRDGGEKLLKRFAQAARALTFCKHTSLFDIFETDDEKRNVLSMLIGCLE